MPPSKAQPQPVISTVRAEFSEEQRWAIIHGDQDVYRAIVIKVANRHSPRRESLLENTALLWR